MTKVATTVVDSISCASDSFYVTWLFAYLCSVLFVIFTIIMCDKEVLWSCPGEGFFMLLVSRCTKRERERERERDGGGGGSVEKIIKIYMCTIVLKMDY